MSRFTSGMVNFDRVFGWKTRNEKTIQKRVSMRKSWLICLAALMLFACNSDPAGSEVVSVTGNAAVDLPKLLPEGIYEARIQGIEQPEQLKVLEAKYKAGIQENYAWFLEYLKEQQVAGQQLPFHPNFGLSPLEYHEMSALLQALRYETVKTERLEITHEQGTIRVQGTGVLDGFGAINVNQDFAEIAPFRCGAPKQTKIIKDNHALGSPWSGYSWKDEPDDLELNSKEDLMKLNTHQVSLTIGLIENTRERYLNIRIKKIDQGATTVNATAVVLF